MCSDGIVILVVTYQLSGNSSADLVLENRAVDSVWKQSHSLVFCHQGIAKTKILCPTGCQQMYAYGKALPCLHVQTLNYIFSDSPWHIGQSNLSDCSCLPGYSCFTLTYPLFSENTFFAGLCILFYPSNWVSTILNRQLIYQSQLSLRTALSSVPVKLL